MRVILSGFLAIGLAAPAWAAEFELDTDVTKVTVFSNGALITREAAFDIPAGQHQILFSEPTNSFDDIPRISLPEDAGLRLVSIELADQDGVPRLGPQSAIYADRLADLKAAEAALVAFEEGDSILLAEIAAAETTLRAVESLSGENGNLVGSQGALNPDATLDLVTKLSAKAAEARVALDRANKALGARGVEADVLLDAVEAAREAVDLAAAEIVDFSRYVVTVEAANAVAGALRVEGFSRDAFWQPSYRVDLNYEDMSGDLLITRQAVLSQNTGVDWTAAEVTLSTANPNARTEMNLPFENALGLRGEDELYKVSRGAVLAPSSADALMEPVVEAIEVQGGPRPLGAAEPVEFTLPNAVTLASAQNGGLMVEIDQISEPVDLFAEANATQDKTAILTANITYDLGGVLLAGQSTIFHNGALVGSGQIDETANGDDLKLGLGPLKSVLVKHRILSREDGDRGLIGSTNAREIRTETEIVNLSGFDVPVQLYDVVPTSEDEDLRVSEIANPRPSERDVEGRRGVLRWDLDMAPGETKIVQFGHDLAWPKDQIIIPQ